MCSLISVSITHRIKGRLSSLEFCKLTNWTQHQHLALGSTARLTISLNPVLLCLRMLQASVLRTDNMCSLIKYIQYLVHSEEKTKLLGTSQSLKLNVSLTFGFTTKSAESIYPKASHTPSLDLRPEDTYHTFCLPEQDWGPRCFESSMTGSLTSRV